jgi:hypothetical protein
MTTKTRRYLTRFVAAVMSLDLVGVLIWVIVGLVTNILMGLALLFIFHAIGAK